MRQAQFYSLPRAVQHRFVESTRGVGFPAALLVRLYKSYAHLKWALAAVASLALWIVFARVGYGDVASSLALAPSALVVVHVLFAVLVVLLGGAVLVFRAEGVDLLSSCPFFGAGFSPD